jgi:hypothetical protein
MALLKGDRGDRRRQREDDVEIGNRQQVGLSRGEPRGSGCPLTLRTMTIPAGIIGDPRHAAVVAGLDVAAERLGSARNNRAHHPPLDATGVVTTIRVAMLAQDMGDLQANARHSSVDGGSVRGRTSGRAMTRIPTRGHPDGVTSSDRRSSGLCVARIVWVATCV